MDHERYRELVALAAGGHLSGPEYAEFESHIAVCSDCRQEYSEFREILFDQFPIVDLVDDVLVKSIPLPASAGAYEERFVARGRAEGIPLQTGPTIGQRLRKLWHAVVVPRPAYAYGLVLIIFALAGLLGYRLHESQMEESAGVKANQGLQAQVDRLQAQNSSLAQRLSEASRTSGAASAELSDTKTKYAALAARYDAIGKELKLASARADALSTEAKSEVEKQEGLSKKLKETEASLASMTEQLQTLRDSNANEVANANERLGQIKDLETQLLRTKQSLDRESRLLAAGRDIHDLMGARSLHITDVFDIDSKGKTERAFGRVFYTEGKFLMFYAFDLNRPRNASHDRAYQVWGYREAAESPVQSLGLLYFDDQKQNRWALKFSDPAVLSEIDSVFVTIEPPGGSEKPTGKKRLYAYLGSPPNHP